MKAAPMPTAHLKNLWLALLMSLSLACGSVLAEVEVFPLRGSNPQQTLETVRAALGDRAQVDMVQQRLVVVGDQKALSDAASLLRKIDRLPANLRLTITEIPPSESHDPNTGMLVYTTDKNSQVIDTVEGAQISVSYEKFHQTVATDGWMFTVNNEPTAVQQLEMRARVVAAHTVEIVMSFTRYENQQRKVYGRVVAGEMGKWIPLLPQRGNDAEPNDAEANNVVSYSSGAKPGEQLYLKVEKVLIPTKRTP
jgi:hypothetical protein